MDNIFVDDSLIKIDLKDGLFVEVTASMSYVEFKTLFAKGEQTDLDFLVAVVKKWNFKSKDGVEMPCNEDNIRKLSSKMVMPLASELIQIYMPEKKILQDSIKK